MSQNFKVKVAHVSEDGSKLEYVEYLTAEDYQSAYLQACSRFQSAVRSLAKEKAIIVNKSKIESGAEEH